MFDALIPAIIALEMPSSRHTRAAQGPPAPPVRLQRPMGRKAQSPDEKKALADFLEAYRLAPGQDLKRVPPPRPVGELLIVATGGGRIA